VEASDRDWKRLGEAMLQRRERLGLSRKALCDRIVGEVTVTPRTLSNYELARLTIKGRIPKGYYAVERALGWAEGSIEAVLYDKGEPILREELEAPAAEPIEERALTSEVMTEYGHVLGFGELCERAGGGTPERDAFDVAARRLVESVPGVHLAVLWRRSVELAAHRPHGEGEFIPADDVARAYRAADEVDEAQE
jgi:hypothetical protein